MSRMPERRPRSRKSLYSQHIVPEYVEGQLVVYTKQKYSCRPGPRACEIYPAAGGDMYSYLVRKFWLVESVGGNRLSLRTPGGKLHRIPKDDPRMRRPSLRERLWLLLVGRARRRKLRRYRLARMRWRP